MGDRPTRLVHTLPPGTAIIFTPPVFTSARAPVAANASAAAPTARRLRRSITWPPLRGLSRRGELVEFGDHRLDRGADDLGACLDRRSEERRVGKECRS